MRGEVVGHRGYSARAPENTMASFRLAAKHGADGIEFDIHVTKDGIPIVIHDATLARTTNGVGAVRGHTLAELQRFDAGAWFDQRFTGETIPTLDDVLALAADASLRVFPEIKGYRDVEELRIVGDALRRHGLTGRAVILAFDWRDLVAIREIEPGIAIGFEVDRADRLEYAMAAAKRYGNACLSCAAKLVDGALLETAADASIPIAAWTVNDPERAAALVDGGVATIMTDDPEAVSRRLRG